MKHLTDTIVSENMTNRDTQDIMMGKLLDMEEISSENHAILMKSLEVMSDVINILNDRITKLEAKVDS